MLHDKLMLHDKPMFHDKINLHAYHQASLSFIKLHYSIDDVIFSILMLKLIDFFLPITKIVATTTVDVATTTYHQPYTIYHLPFKFNYLFVYL